MLDVLGGYGPTSTFLGGVWTHLSIFRGGQDFAAFGCKIEGPLPIDVFDTFP